MFDLIIRDGQKESYINIKDNKLFGVNISNGIITNLTEEEVNIIKSLKLSNDKVYLGIEDGYEVYIDNNTLLKHYFKNGKEDIRKFIEINATVATLFDDNQNQLPEEEIEYQIEVKGKKKIFAKLKDLFVVFATTYIIIGGVVLGSEIYKLYQNKTPITYEEICTIINSCSNLTEDEKTWFTNEKLLNDIIPYYNGTNMGNIIRLRNTNLTIKLHDSYYKEYDDREVLGWYSEMNGSILNIVGTQEERKDGKLASTEKHEYIHLLENYSKYYYLIEGITEIINQEYFMTNRENVYDEERINLKILMEIIGPKPIWEIAFANDDSKMVDIIRSNMSYENSNRLLELLETNNANQYKKSKNIHKEIYGLLEELYYNINNESMSENKVISALIDNTLKDRYYFNSDLIETNLPYIETSILTINYPEYKKYYLYGKDIDYEKYKEYKEDKIDNTLDLKFFEVSGAVVKNEEVEYNGETYPLEEAVNKGLVNICLVKKTTEEIPEADDWDYCEKKCSCIINVEEKEIDLDSLYEYTENGVEYTIDYIPTIYETFPNQKINQTSTNTFNK